MNDTDFVIHIQTENDTLLGKIERESHEFAIEDVNQVRRFIIGTFVLSAVLIGVIAIAVYFM